MGFAAAASNGAGLVASGELVAQILWVASVDDMSRIAVEKEHSVRRELLSGNAQNGQPRRFW